MAPRYTVIILMYVRIICIKIVNYITWVFGFTRVYDLQNCVEITLLYHILKLVSKFNLPINIDMSYPKLGICTYDNDRYVRYICYDEKLSALEKRKKNISAKKYHDIKRIELVDRSRQTDKHRDVTDAKLNFYDVDYFTDPFDMVRFYQLYRGDINLIYRECSDISIVFTREIFDDNLLEFVVSHEETD